MKPYILLLPFVSHTFAARWIIDQSCNKRWPDDQIKKGVQEAFDLAENAIKVMTDHASDDKVQSMAKCMLGTTKYQANWDTVKRTLEKVLEFEREPSPFSGPRDPEWLSVRNNKDVEFYCDSSRLRRKTSGGKVTMKDPARGGRHLSDKEYEGFEECDAKESKIWGFTSPSDFYDSKAYNKAKDECENVKKKDYIRETEFAYSIQLCKSYIKKHKKEGWFRVDEQRIEFIRQKSEELKADGLNPIDSVRSVGNLILHELTHTKQAGDLLDKKTSDKKAAYGWKRCGMVEDPLNSDTVAMLALAFKVWSAGDYYVGDSGEILTR